MTLYAFGSNGAGQLGISHKNDENTPQPCQISTKAVTKSPLTPIRVAAGGNTTVLLLNCGLLLSAGADLLWPDELPDQERPIVSAFRQCSRASKTKLCSLTWEAAIIVTVDNTIHVCGNGPKGELGLGPDIHCLPSPNGERKLENFPPKAANVVDLASSVSHVVVVLSTGEVYGWGNGRSGQLGEPAGVIWTPRRIEGLDFKVARAVCGRNFTYLLGDPRNGDHSIIGSDKWGIKSQAPSQVKGWKEIGASWGSLFVLDNLGSITSWGRGDHGQLAPSDLPAIASIAVGSEHVVALTENGKVHCWGWGEHGNCGGNINKKENVKGESNEIALQDESHFPNVVGIGAGCATSFLWTE